MAASAVHQLAPVLRASATLPAAEQPSILVGVTDAQTCLVLRSRLRALREAGFRVTVVSSPGVLLDQAAALAGVDSYAIPMRRGIAPFADLVAVVRLWRLLGRCRPEIVEFSTPKAGLLGSLAACLRGVPRRVYLLRGLRLETASGWKRQLLLGMERLAAACAHVVLCNSESLRARAVALGVAPELKLHLLGEGSSNGVDMEQFAPGPSSIRERLGLARNTPPGSPIVGFVGRLTRDKGVPELIEAFDVILRAEPEARLLLVGWFDKADDALDETTRRRILSHPRIHHTGFVEATAPYYRAMDVMVLPTWREGFPNVVLEAAASGVPVVTTACTGSRDSVVPEVTGLLIPPGNAAAISDAVLSLLGDPERRRRMGHAARAWVREHYMDERVLGLTAAFYLDLRADSLKVEASAMAS